MEYFNIVYTNYDISMGYICLFASIYFTNIMVGHILQKDKFTLDKTSTPYDLFTDIYPVLKDMENDRIEEFVELINSYNTKWVLITK